MTSASHEASHDPLLNRLRAVLYLKSFARLEKRTWILVWPHRWLLPISKGELNLSTSIADSDHQSMQDGKDTLERMTCWFLPFLARLLYVTICYWLDGKLNRQRHVSRIVADVPHMEHDTLIKTHFYSSVITKWKYTMRTLTFPTKSDIFLSGAWLNLLHFLSDTSETQHQHPVC